MVSTKKIYIVGTGGFAREVLWLIRRINQNGIIWDVQGFIDNSKDMDKCKIENLNVIKEEKFFSKKHEDFYVVIAVANVKIRKQISEKFSKFKNVKFATLIDPNAIVSDRVYIGEGSIICANTIVTVDIKIGKHVIVNLDCTIGHNTIIEDFVTIYPNVNVSGNVNVGKETEIGTGTKIIQGKIIGSGSILGAGSIVVKDIPDNCTAVGSPAKPIKFREGANR